MSDNNFKVKTSIEYSGHMHRRSSIETCSDCGNCDGANCEDCKKIYIGILFNKERYESEEFYRTANFDEYTKVFCEKFIEVNGLKDTFLSDVDIVYHIGYHSNSKFKFLKEYYIKLFDQIYPDGYIAGERIIDNGFEKIGHFINCTKKTTSKDRYLYINDRLIFIYKDVKYYINDMLVHDYTISKIAAIVSNPSANAKQIR